MASSLTITEDLDVARLKGPRKIKWAWTSHTDGVVTGVATTGYYSGKIVRFVTDPGATAPTDDYDITILDDDGYDVLIGAGTDRDTANTEQVTIDGGRAYGNDAPDEAHLLGSQRWVEQGRRCDSVYRMSDWGGLTAVVEAQIESELPHPQWDCPRCGEPLDERDGIWNCPLGHYRSNGQPID